MRTSLTSLATAGCVVWVLAASPALAQQTGQAGGSGSQPAPAPPPSDSQIEEIVILGAESEGAGDFASADSVTAFGAEDLAALGAQDIADLAAFTPNLEIVTSGATTPTFFIRGVGLNDFNANSTGAVAIYRDDVPYNAPALQLGTLFDVEQVNILRGPQGSGLARNASAGAIKIYSRKPSGEFGAFLRSDLGNFDYRDFEGAIEAPIYEDILATRLAFRLTQRDGTMKNRCGDAPPIEERVPVAPGGGPDGLPAINKRDSDPPWSICGEPVVRSTDNPVGLSTIPEGLPTRVNNIDNWAARGTLLFQPTLDQSWLLGAHGSRRDELSRLGQSYGTNGFFCPEGRPCSPSAFDHINGLLGGKQNNQAAGYQAPEVRQRLIELEEKMLEKAGAPDTVGPCFGGNNDRTFDRAGSKDCDTVIQNLVKIQVAKELARGLDDEPWEGDFNHIGPTTQDTWGTYLRGDLVLPGGIDLFTITSYDTYDRTIDIDLDFSPETLFHILTEDEGWQFAQNVKLSGQLGAESAVRWELGGWFLREKLDVVVTNDLGRVSALGVGQRDYTQDMWSVGSYGGLAFDFWEDFTLDGGVRYNWEQKKLDYILTLGAIETPFPEKLDETWSAPTGTVRLTYRFREDTHVFWKYTRGWKPGTYNATSSRDLGVSTADPEFIDSFETGIRGSWFEGRFGMDFNLFYYSYDDYQIFIAQQFANSQPEFVIINANDAEVYGAEIDATARPWDGAFLNLRFSWLESQFLDFVQVQQETIAPSGVQVTVNREIQNSGNRLLNSPQFKVSLTAEQSLPLGRWGTLTARYDGSWTDTTYYDATEGRGIPNAENIEFLPEDTVAQPAYWLHNLRLSYRPPGGNIEIAGWVRNLTNKAYKSFAFDASTFFNTSVYFVGDPRTYGASVFVSF